LTLNKEIYGCLNRETLLPQWLETARLRGEREPIDRLKEEFVLLMWVPPDQNYAPI
jgi:hypothetical protein